MERIEEGSKKKIRRRSHLPQVLQQFMDGGKLPPQALDLEEAVLGAMMLEREAVNDVIDILKPQAFYKDANRAIFEAIQKLFKRSEPIDILMVTNELKTNGELDAVGGPYYISQLTNRVASSANVEYHARIIAQKYIQRELIRISSETIHDAYEDSSDVFELLDQTEKGLYAITEGNIRKSFDKMSTLIGKAIDQIEKAKSKEDGVSGVPSGFTELDRITSGWQKSDLIIMASRPGMGKTAFVLSMARNIAVEFKIPVAVFSLEMSSLQLVNRLISSETGLPGDKLRRGKLADHEWTQLNERIDQLAEAPLFIDDTPALSIFELRAKCRRLKAKHNVELIILDYLQLMSGGGESKGANREQEISTLSRSLKSIAKELDVPIITLSQLNRQVETRGGNKRPQLSDLRESGAIEQDADLVLFIYRPEYYGMDQDAEGNRIVKGLTEIIVAKHRNGPLASAYLRFNERLTKFSDMDESAGSRGYDPEEGEGKVVTIRSRMNDQEEEDPGGDIPF